MQAQGNGGPWTGCLCAPIDQNHQLSKIVCDDFNIAHDYIWNISSRRMLSNNFFIEALDVERSLMRNERHQNRATIWSHVLRSKLRIWGCKATSRQNFSGPCSNHRWWSMGVGCLNIYMWSVKVIFVSTAASLHPSFLSRVVTAVVPPHAVSHATTPPKSDPKIYSFFSTEVRHIFAV